MLHLLVSLWCKNTFSVGVGGKMNPRIRLTSAKVGVGVEVEAELGNIKTHKIKSQCNWDATYIRLWCNIDAS